MTHNDVVFSGSIFKYPFPLENMDYVIMSNCKYDLPKEHVSSSFSLASYKVIVFLILLSWLVGC